MKKRLAALLLIIPVSGCFYGPGFDPHYGPGFDPHYGPGYYHGGHEHFHGR